MNPCAAPIRCSTGDRLIDGILEERHLLKNLKEHADMVIDTSILSIHQLSTKLYEAMLGSGPTTVSVHIFSFGFKYGIPIDADFVADVRFFPTRSGCPNLRSLTGTDKPVTDYVLSSKGAEEFSTLTRKLSRLRSKVISPRKTSTT